MGVLRMRGMDGLAPVYCFGRAWFLVEGLWQG
jgi:hypothetical protein